MRHNEKKKIATHCDWLLNLIIYRLPRVNFKILATNNFLLKLSTQLSPGHIIITF